MVRNHTAPKIESPANPNFVLVGEAKSTPAPYLVELLKFAEVVPAGKNRWNVRCSTPERIGRHAAHTVALTCCGLFCDCRQGVAGRECVHIVAVRQLGTVTIKPRLPEEVRLYADEANVPVRVVPPARKRIAVMRLQPRTAPNIVNKPRTSVAAATVGGAA